MNNTREYFITFKLGGTGLKYHRMFEENLGDVISILQEMHKMNYVPMLTQQHFDETVIQYMENDCKNKVIVRWD